jgi:hypothetical protein
MRTLALLTTYALLSVVACSDDVSTPSDQGGSSSEVVAMVGSAQYVGGAPAANAVVTLRTWDYLPGPAGLQRGATQIANDTTDDSGAFFIDSVDLGDYALEVTDLVSRAVMARVVCTPDSQQLRMGILTLVPTGTLSGAVTVPSGSAAATYAMVYGTEHVARVDSAGRYQLTGLPEGAIDIRIATSVDTVGASDTAGVIVVSGATLDIGTTTLRTFAGENYADWAHSRRVVINTTASGADISQDLTGVPLVIKLDANNFDFSQSRSFIAGADIRVASAAGRHLPYEVERWDAAAQQAEIWVRPDTLYGDDSTQFIALYCGNAAAASWSSGPSVFDTSLGFAAVWHFGMQLTDATVNANNGTGTNTPLAAGAVGPCRSFDGATSYIRIDSSWSLNMAGRGLTIVLWEQSGGTYGPERMFFEHDIWPNAGEYMYSSRTPITLSFDFPAADSEARVDGPAIADGAWHQVAVAFDDAGDTAANYYDGVAAGTSPVRSTIASSNGRSYIGARGGVARFFRGSMDEMWIMNRPQSPLFLKAAYENQRPGQTMVTVR